MANCANSMTVSLEAEACWKLW